MRRHIKRAVFLSLGISAGLLALHVDAVAQSAGFTRQIAVHGSAAPQNLTQGSDAIQIPEFAPAFGPDAKAAAPSNSAKPRNPRVNRHMSAFAGDNGENESDHEKSASNPKLLMSFQGLNHRDQRLANGGNQFSLEPPDQGLCAGNGHIVEALNDVFRVYDTSGNPQTGVVDLNTFYGYPAAFDRTTGLEGPFITDPSCLFDAATQRFFLVVLTLDVDPATGDFLGPNHLDLAVSTSPDPTGTWTVYSLPVQDDGTSGTPNHHCYADVDSTGHGIGSGPCLGDYPHIGADAYGVYLTTNEYDFFGFTFHGAQVYGFSKAALAANSPNVTVVQFDTASSAPGHKPGFTIWPAQASQNQFDLQDGGTQFALSSTATDEAQCKSGVVCTGTHTSRKILLWTLTHTASLGTNKPKLSLSNEAIEVARYAIPPPSNQKTGDFPLGQCINDTTFVTPFGPGCWQLFFNTEPAHDEVVSTLDSNDSRMQQVWYANGALWSALDTALTVKGKPQAGIEYFAVNPRSGELRLQGRIGVAGNNLTYPAIAMTDSGRGVMAFTVVGNDHFPSAGYAGVNKESGAGVVHIAAEGVGPQDGFSGYKAFGDPPRPRWGDYGSALIDGNTMWIASEYIGQSCTLAQYLTGSIGSCGATRTSLANWSTRISNVQP
jgi:hypothetical protein